ncbi:MAG: Rpn family recombination-promoting nuclease/putative transposase [Deltaproteobacteria bacterium]|nr:Rpn family recombination-promoting nuclease/putative transposase [Deltaproteobacteria bacterium]
MSDLTNSHDHFFKGIFSVKAEAEDFLSNYLPEEVAGLLKLDTLELGKDTYVDPELRESLSDLVYRVETTSAGPAVVYILFEHKSRPEPLIAFYLLRYMVKMWGQFIEQGWKAPLPPIIPLVFYHGPARWELDRRFQGLVAHHPALQSFLPDFQFLFYDLGPHQTEEIRGRFRLQAALLMLCLIFHPNLRYRIREILERLGRLEWPEDADLFRKVVHYIEANSDKISELDLSQAVHDVYGDIKEDAMPGFMQTWVEKGVQKGRQEGLQEGRQEGRQEGSLADARESVVDILESRFGAVPSPLAALINQLDDLAVLKMLRKKAVTVETMDNFRVILGQIKGN